MRLAEYIELAKKELDAFAAYYVMAHDKNPENWPLHMSHGNFDDQFRMFLGISSALGPG